MKIYDRFEMRNVIDRYVIDSRYREVLSLKFCEGLTYEQIGESTNYSTQHVKHICTAYRDCLMAHL